MKVTRKQFDLAKQVVNHVPKEVMQKVSEVPSYLAFLVKRANTYEDFIKLYKETYNKPKVTTAVKLEEPKTPVKVPVHTDPNLVAEVAKLTQKIEEMLEAYKWVVEHAQVDYKKKNAWFR